MESNEILVLNNFYSRVAKTTGIVKMSRKPFLMFFHQKPHFVEDQADSSRVVEYFTTFLYGMVHLGGTFKLGALLVYGKSLYG